MELETPAALLTTDYGRIFLGQIVAVICLLGLAVLNRQRLTPMLGYQAAGARYLLRSIVGEIGLAIMILGLVATWRFTPPPRALAASSAEPVNMHMHTAQAMVAITVTPGAGRPREDEPVPDDRRLRGVESEGGNGHGCKPERWIEPIERRAVKETDGTWQVEALILPVPGRWRVRVDVLVSDFEKATLEDDIEIQP